MSLTAAAGGDLRLRETGPASLIRVDAHLAELVGLAREIAVRALPRRDRIDNHRAVDAVGATDLHVECPPGIPCVACTRPRHAGVVAGTGGAESKTAGGVELE